MLPPMIMPTPSTSRRADCDSPEGWPVDNGSDAGL